MVEQYLCPLQQISPPIGPQIDVFIVQLDEDRQERFWRHRPDEFTVHEKEYIIYVLKFKRVSDLRYVSETQKLAEIQHLAVTQGLKKLFKDTQWTVESSCPLYRDTSRCLQTYDRPPTFSRSLVSTKRTESRLSRIWEDPVG